MKIDYPLKKELINEISFVRKRIIDYQEIRKKVFFYSGIYGIIQRIMNLQYNPHLQFAEFIFNNTYQALLSRYQINKSEDDIIPISHEIFDKIVLFLEELVTKIEHDEDIFEELQKIVNIVFLTTGNGYYLKEKGII